jgi:hypothetical protein
VNATFLRPYRRDGWTTRQSALLESFYPRNANAVSVTTSGAAWSWSAYVQIVASTSAAFIPHELQLAVYPEPKSNAFMRVFFEIELARGASGSEVAIATLSGAFVSQVSDYAGGSTILGTGFTLPLDPDLIVSGSRLAIRARLSIADTTATMNARAYLAGYDGAAPAGDRAYPLDEHLAGAHNAVTKVAPSGGTTTVTAGASWSPGSWVEFIASASGPLLLLGVTSGDSASLLQQGHYVELGIGASGSETVHARLAVPGRGFLNGGCQVLRRPVHVLAGERVALRAASAGAVAVPHQLIYSDLA